MEGARRGILQHVAKEHKREDAQGQAGRANLSRNTAQEEKSEDECSINMPQAPGAQH